VHDLHVDITDGRRNFSPGETLTGRASWTADPVPSSAELRLFWYTRGKGTQDVGVVESVPLASPQVSDRRDFRFVLPHEPYSCSGSLVSIVWALELIIEPGTRASRVEFIMAPSGAEVVLAK
jgi:hypothetical protein